MNKVTQWLIKADLSKGMKYVLWFYLCAAGFNGYSVYSQYQEGDWLLVNHAFAVGLFMTSALYYSVVIFWQKESTKRINQITNLIIENHQLKHELLVKKASGLHG